MKRTSLWHSSDNHHTRGSYFINSYRYAPWSCDHDRRGYEERTNQMLCEKSVGGAWVVSSAWVTCRSQPLYKGDENCEENPWGGGGIGTLIRRKRYSLGNQDSPSLSLVLPVVPPLGHQCELCCFRPPHSLLPPPSPIWQVVCSTGPVTLPGYHPQHPTHSSPAKCDLSTLTSEVIKLAKRYIKSTFLNGSSLWARKDRTVSMV